MQKENFRPREKKKEVACNSLSLCMCASGKLCLLGSESKTKSQSLTKAFHSTDLGAKTLTINTAVRRNCTILTRSLEAATSQVSKRTTGRSKPKTKVETFSKTFMQFSSNKFNMRKQTKKNSSMEESTENLSSGSNNAAGIPASIAALANLSTPVANKNSATPKRQRISPEDSSNAKRNKGNADSTVSTDSKAEESFAPLGTPKRTRNRKVKQQEACHNAVPGEAGPRTGTESEEALAIALEKEIDSSDPIDSADLSMELTDDEVQGFLPAAKRNFNKERMESSLDRRIDELVDRGLFGNAYKGPIPTFNEDEGSMYSACSSATAPTPRSAAVAGLVNGIQDVSIESPESLSTVRSSSTPVVTENPAAGTVAAVPKLQLGPPTQAAFTDANTPQRYLTAPPSSANACNSAANFSETKWPPLPAQTAHQNDSERSQRALSPSKPSSSGRTKNGAEYIVIAPQGYPEAHINEDAARVIQNALTNNAGIIENFNPRIKSVRAINGVITIEPMDLPTAKWIIAAVAAGVAGQGLRCRSLSADNYWLPPVFRAWVPNVYATFRGNVLTALRDALDANNYENFNQFFQYKEIADKRSSRIQGKSFIFFGTVAFAQLIGDKERQFQFGFAQTKMRVHRLKGLFEKVKTDDPAGKRLTLNKELRNSNSLSSQVKPNRCKTQTWRNVIVSTRPGKRCEEFSLGFTVPLLTSTCVELIRQETHRPNHRKLILIAVATTATRWIEIHDGSSCSSDSPSFALIERKFSVILQVEINTLKLILHFEIHSNRNFCCSSTTPFHSEMNAFSSHRAPYCLGSKSKSSKRTSSELNNWLERDVVFSTTKQEGNLRATTAAILIRSSGTRSLFPSPLPNTFSSANRTEHFSRFINKPRRHNLFTEESVLANLYRKSKETILYQSQSFIQRFFATGDSLNMNSSNYNVPCSTCITEGGITIRNSSQRHSHDNISDSNSVNKSQAQVVIDFVLKNLINIGCIKFEHHVSYLVLYRKGYRKFIDRKEAFNLAEKFREANVKLGFRSMQLIASVWSRGLCFIISNETFRKKWIQLTSSRFPDSMKDIFCSAGVLNSDSDLKCSLKGINGITGKLVSCHCYSMLTAIYSQLSENRGLKLKSSDRHGTQGCCKASKAIDGINSIGYVLTKGKNRTSMHSYAIKNFAQMLSLYSLYVVPFSQTASGRLIFEIPPNQGLLTNCFIRLLHTSAEELMSSKTEAVFYKRHSKTDPCIKGLRWAEHPSVWFIRSCISQARRG